MADKYAKWNLWAPQFISDLVNDFDLTPQQASGFPGNAAVESAYFRDIVEDGAIAKGSAGGTGFFQWTGLRKGERRLAFEDWLRRTKHLGYRADNYLGNYSYLYRELKGAEGRRVLPSLRQCTSAEQAAYVVGKQFERPASLSASLAKRQKAAREALALWVKNPPPVTVWPTDKPAPPPGPRPPVTPPSECAMPPAAIPPATIPAILPDAKAPASTKRMQGTWLMLAGIAADIITRYTGAPQDAVLNALVTYGPTLAAAAGAIISWIGQKTADAPVAGTPLADIIELVKAQSAQTAQAAQAVMAAHTEEAARGGIHEFPQGMPAVPEPAPVQPSDIQLKALPLEQLVEQLPELIQQFHDLRDMLTPVGRPPPQS